MKIKSCFYFASGILAFLFCNMVIGVKQQVVSAGSLDKPNVNLLEVDKTDDEAVLPSSYCMRDDYIVYAQHQDKHGYCWNFAATMSASTTIMRHTNEYYDFSELWNGITCFNGTNYYPEVGGGGYFDYQYDAIKYGGLMLETDLPYQYLYTVSNQNADDYYNFFKSYSNDNLVDCLQGKSFSRTAVEEIKKHIYNHGSAYMEFEFRTGYNPDENGITALPPNQNNPNSAHAVSIVGWDDNYQREFYLNGSETPTLFKGAWLILNSYTETSGNEGLSFVFYDDLNVYDIHGYTYEQDTTKDLYFYDKIEEGYAYPNPVKGKYCGDFMVQSGATKQKNIFYDDVNLQYSYIASEGASVQDVHIYLDNFDVTEDFNIQIDNGNKRFSIVKDDAKYGQYKVLVSYGNGMKADTYLNNFFVTYGLLGEKLEFNTEANNLAFNVGRDLEYYSVICSDKDYAIYTNQLNGSISFIPTEYTSIYSDKNMSIPTLSFNIIDGVGCTVTHTVTSNSGYPLQYNFHVEYYEDTTLQPVNVYYNLNGGVNHTKNYGKELANDTTDLLLYEPTREGYTFKGWYLSNGDNTEQLRQDGDLWYIDWGDIHHMGEAPTLWASSYYKKYYKNSNVVFVQARWEETKHVVTWKNWDGTELYKGEYSFGTYPVYGEEKGSPTKPDDEKYDYTFIGWEPRVESVDKDVSYTAVYKAIPKEYTISVSSSENGTVTSSGNGIVTCLDVLTYTFTSNEGYKIKDVKVDGVSVGAVSTYTFAGVTENRTLSVEFETIQNKIVLSIEGKGSATSDKALNEVIFGDNRTITFVPEKKWKILCAFVNGERVAITDNQLTLTSIKEEMQVVVVFEEKEGNVSFLATVIPTAMVAVSSTGALIYIGCKMRKKRSMSKTLGDSSPSNDGE